MGLKIVKMGGGVTFSCYLTIINTPRGGHPPPVYIPYIIMT